ncbi:hypothetical protein E4U37_002073 [Claviceps purpurea]|nr:hypothetical protein E4U37_002073 [Claviceps purpurea]
MVASSNFGNVFSMLAAAAWLSFTWMMSIQLLAQNLLYDISQIAIPWDSVDPESSSLRRRLVVLGPTSSVIDILTFALNWFYYIRREDCRQRGSRAIDSDALVPSRTSYPNPHYTPPPNRQNAFHTEPRGSPSGPLHGRHHGHWLRHHLDTAYPACPELCAAFAYVCRVLGRGKRGTHANQRATSVMRYRTISM